jgi:putative NIF3 family GTP cyclohydrolase 1 type 2
LGLKNILPLDGEGILVEGTLSAPTTAQDFALKVSAHLGREALLIGNASKPLHRLAWCTGGGGSYFEAAIAAGVDAFLTGEASEQHVHLARESGVPLILAGHHATERYGVQALGAALGQSLGIETQYVEIDSPL